MYKWEYKNKNSKDDWCPEAYLAYNGSTLSELKEKANRYFNAYGNPQRITDLSGKVIFELPAPPKVKKKAKKRRVSIPGLKINPQRVRYKCENVLGKKDGQIVYAYRLQSGFHSGEALLFLPRQSDEAKHSGSFILAVKNVNGVYEDMRYDDELFNNWMNVE